MDSILNIKKLLLLIVIVLVSNCQIKEKEAIDFEVLNSELSYAPIFQKPMGNSKEDYINSIYNRYKNLDDWEKSLNRIQLKLTNNSKNKILFFKKTYIKERILKQEIDEGLISNFYFQVKENDSTNKDLRTIHSISDNFSSKLSEFEKQQIKEDSIKINEIRKRGYNSLYDFKRLNGYSVINPNESIIFEVNISLPITIDYKNLLDTNIGLPMYNDNTYKLKFHYVINKEDVETNMPKHILDSLQKEEVIIKNIHLTSREIDVLPNY